VGRIYGVNAVTELLDVAPGALERVVLASDAPGSARAVAERARELGVSLDEVSAAELRSRAGGRGGAAIGADVRRATVPDVRDLAPRADAGETLIALDQVTDPHNLGAILRSAGAYGARALIVPKDHAAPLNDAAVRASAGAVAYVPVIRVTNLARTIRTLASQGWWSVATESTAPRALWSVDLRGPTVLVLGAEGRGIRHGVLKACDLTAAMPLPGLVRSLNVSVAAGVALAELTRQRAPNGAA